MGDQEPGEHVVLDDFTSAPNGRSVRDGPDHSEDAEVGGDDGVALRRVEQHRVGIEMVGPLGIALLSGNVEQQVGGESEDLLADEHEQGVQGGVSQVVLPVDLFVGQVWDAEVGAGLGNVHLIFLH